MATAAAFATSTVPSKLISIILRKELPAMGPFLPTNRPGVAMPAQLIAALTLPIRAFAWVTAPSTAVSSLTSTAKKAARSPSAAAAALPCGTLRSKIAALPPACTIRFATASPSPEAPPVTMAFTSFNCMQTPYRWAFRMAAQGFGS